MNGTYLNILVFGSEMSSDELDGFSSSISLGGQVKCVNRVILAFFATAAASANFTRRPFERVASVHEPAASHSEAVEPSTWGRK